MIEFPYGCSVETKKQNAMTTGPNEFLCTKAKFFQNKALFSTFLSLF